MNAGNRAGFRFTEKNAMTRHVFIFGLILGAILAAHAVYMMNLLHDNPAIESNDVLGYAAMIVVFSLIFFGIRNYRNKELGGLISFGHALRTGALIAVVGSSMYVVIGLLNYYLFMPDFLEKYAEHVMIMATRHGASSAELAARQQEMDQFKEMYKNPLFAILISYMEVLPIGLVVALVSSFILKKKATPVAR